MKKIIYFLIFIFIQTSITAQNLPIKKSDYLRIDNNKEKDPVVGSTYLAKTFKPLIIKTRDNKIGKFKSGNYNIKKGKFFTKTVEGNFSIDDTSVTEIVFLGYRFKKINDQYYAFPFKERIDIVKKYELHIQSGPKDPLSKAKIKPDSYVVKEAYYLLNKEGEPESFKLKKKNILSLFSKEKSSSIKKYMKENKLSYRKEKDLKVLFSNIK
ncbi:MAG: hypothetical protein JXR05_06840 [Flavobacteriaceae bacterium]